MTLFWFFVFYFEVNSVLTACFCHITYLFQIEFAFYTPWLLIVKELLDRSRRYIRSLNGSNRTLTHNNLFPKRTLACNQNGLFGIMFECLLGTKWFWVRIPLLSHNPIAMANNVWDKCNWGSLNFNNIFAVYWDYVKIGTAKFFIGSPSYTLKLPGIKMFLYLVLNLSNVMLIISRWFLILLLCGIYQQLLSPFFYEE